MTVLGPLLILVLAAAAAVAWIVSGPVALAGVGIGIFIRLFPAGSRFKRCEEVKSTAKQSYKRRQCGFYRPRRGSDR